MANLQIILCRSEEDNQNTIAELIAAGVEDTKVSLPCLEFIEPDEGYEQLDWAIKKNHEYSWLIFLSQKAVEVFLDRLVAIGGQLFHLHPNLKIAVIGESTKKYIENEIAFPVDFIPREFNSDVFIDEFSQLLMEEGYRENKKILLPRTAMVKDDFAAKLEACAFIELEIVPAYSTTCPEPREIHWDEKEEYLFCFTSSQIVRNFKKLYGEQPLKMQKARVLSLGPKCSGTILEEFPFLAESGKLDEAKPATISGMIAVIKSKLNAKHTI